LVLFCLSGVIAHAQSELGWGRGNVQCTSTDTGWEEHWGGHASCEECLRKHGSCVETCSSTYYVCQTQGTDQSGRTFTNEGRGDTRYEAEDEAMRACYYYRYQGCRVTNCNQNSETVS